MALYLYYVRRLVEEGFSSLNKILGVFSEEFFLPLVEIG